MPFKFPVTAAEQTRMELAQLNQRPPAEVQPAALTAQQKFALLKRRAVAAMENIERNRKEVYEILTDLQENCRDYGFQTFAAATEGTFGRGKSWGYNFIWQMEAEMENCKVSTSVDESTDKTTKKESAALKQVEDARKRPAVHSADEKDAEPSKPPMDKSGAVIPQRLIPLFQRREELTRFMSWFGRARKLLENLQTTVDPLYLSIKEAGVVQTLMKDAEALYYAFRNCQPEIVCPLCDGGNKKVGSNGRPCPECAGSGMIYEERWNRDWVKSNDRLKQEMVKARQQNLK